MALDIGEARDRLESEIEFDYVESEGNDCVRFDLGSNSFWIYQNGSVVDIETFSKKIQKQVRSILATCQDL
jgi:hypothetical protein